MKRTKIVNATLLPLHNDTKIIEDGEIILEGDRILALGKRPLGIEGIHEEINATGDLIMPGLINTHTHAAMVLFRSYYDDIPLMDWLHKIWPLEAKLKGEYVYWATLLAALEMLKTGTTTFIDMYFFMEEVARAVKEIGIRAVLSRGLIGIGEGQEKKLNEARDLFTRWDGEASGRITTMIAPHAPYTCPLPFLKKTIALAEEINRPIHIHLSETKGEVRDSLKEHGISPVAWAENGGLLAHPHVLAAHCVHIDANDIDILARRNVYVSSNPQSNLKLGSGICPVKDLLSKGVSVSLGTDGAASNNNLNLWEEIRLVTLLQKGLQEEASLLPAGEVLLMATIKAAQAAGLKNEIGSLHPGKKGDLIFIDLQKPHLYPQHNLLSHLVYALYGNEVKRVFVNGKEVLAKGALLTFDEEEIMRKTGLMTRKLLQEE